MTEVAPSQSIAAPAPSARASVAGRAASSILWGVTALGRFAIGVLGRRLAIPQLLPNAVAELPVRIRHLRTAQDIASERLISWMQLAFVMVLAALWLVSPKPVDRPVSHVLESPVPIALGIYGALTALRLALAYHIRLRPPLLIASILADMALLTGLVWAFHIQYSQPPAFSLKIPTFIYFFVFIAVRALCLDWRYVVIAGLAAASAWSALVALVLVSSPPDTLTHSFTAYMGQHRVLVGAEIEKIAVLLVFTTLLAIIVHRAEATLVRAIMQQAKGDALSRFMSHGLADRIASADTEIRPGEAVERNAAVLVLDIRGFTSFASDHSPAEVVALLTRAHARIVPIVRNHGGVIDKFLGDGVMATFGAVAPSETAAADALRALDATMASIADWRRETSEQAGASGGPLTALDMNGAVVAGPVLFAALGAADRLEYTVIGPAANLAAKLEKFNKRAGARALTLRPTFEAAIAQGYVPRPDLRTMRDVHVPDTPNLLDLVVLA